MAFNKTEGEAALDWLEWKSTINGAPMRGMTIRFHPELNPEICDAATLTLYGYWCEGCATLWASPHRSRAAKVVRSPNKPADAQLFDGDHVEGVYMDGAIRAAAQRVYNDSARTYPRGELTIGGMTVPLRDIQVQDLPRGQSVEAAELLKQLQITYDKAAKINAGMSTAFANVRVGGGMTFPKFAKHEVPKNIRFQPRIKKHPKKSARKGRSLVRRSRRGDD